MDYRAVSMLTFQDLQELGDSEERRIEFVRQAIAKHKSTELYATAKVADDYIHQRNTTITEFQKVLYKVTGEAVPDTVSANFKLPSNYFYRFVTAQNQFSLGNGVEWENRSATEGKLGIDFDMRLQELGHAALVGGVAFGFYNLDHLEVFTVEEFAPIYDEENGALMAGVRFWQVEPNRPLRATLYEVDGYTDYIWSKENEKGEILNEKSPYKLIIKTSQADGSWIYDGKNYPGFPVIPLWGSPLKQSEIVGIREQIDCYDLIKSGFANDLDDASQIYWILQNTGGMQDIDLTKFVERMKTVKAAVVDGDDGVKAESHTLEVPYQSREAMLETLKKDLYRDYMALDTENIASGAVTATQIQAAYEPVNNKADQYEHCILDFLQELMKIAGIEGENPSFTRSYVVNRTEEIQTLATAAPYLSDEYVTERILTIYGDGDKAEDMVKQMEADGFERLNFQREQAGGIENENENENGNEIVPRNS